MGPCREGARQDGDPLSISDGGGYGTLSLPLPPGHPMPHRVSYAPGKAIVRSREAKCGPGITAGTRQAGCQGRAPTGACARPAPLGDRSWFSTQECQEPLPADWLSATHTLANLPGSHCAPTASPHTWLSQYTHSAHVFKDPPPQSGGPSLTGPGFPWHGREHTHVCAARSCHAGSTVPRTGLLQSHC